MERQRQTWLRPVGRGSAALGWSAVLCAALVAMPQSAPVGAQEGGRIQATVDRNQVTLGNQIYLTIRIDGSPDQPPRLPEMPDFRVVSRGQQRDFQFSNGRSSASTSYNYLLIPVRAGTFEIGPAVALVDGAEVSSLPFTVEVIAAEEAAAEQDRALFVTASVSTGQPWQGQQVIYTWRFYSRVRVGQGSIESMDFGSDVVAEDLGEVREFTTAIEGVQYRVNEVRKALFPQRAGEIVLPPTQLSVEVLVEEPRRQSRRRSVFDDFDSLLGRGGRWETRYLVTEPVTLDVRPLPPPPAGWNGLVGAFDISASLSRRELQVGQSATLEVRVAGAGNVQLLSEPPFPELPAFKIYPDQPTSDIDSSGRHLTGRRVFRRALVPLVVGALDIPPLDLVYFDPDLGEYVERSTQRIDLEVTPADGEEELMLTESLAPTTGKVAVRILADDILPIRRTAAGIVSAAPQGWRAWLWLAGGVLPPILYFVLLTQYRRERRYAADRTLRRRQRALRQALAAANRLTRPSGTEGTAGTAGTAEASRVLRAYVGDKLGIEGSALTPGEAETALVGAGVEPDVAARCRAELERFEAAQYGVGVEPGTETGDALSPSRIDSPRRRLRIAGAARPRHPGGQSGELLSELIRSIDRQLRRRKG